MKYNKQLKHRPMDFREIPILVIYLLWLIFSFSCKHDASEEYTVMSGPFKQTIIETGELDAVKASVITVPNINWQYGYQFKIIGLAEHGKTVRKGDSVVSLDPSSLYKFIIGREESLENEKAAANKQQVQMENNIQDLEAQLKNEQAAYDLKKLELDRIKYESESKKKVKELEFQQSVIRLNKVKRNLELKPKLEDLDLKIQKIRVIQRENEIKDARQTLKKLTIHSPLNGIFQVSQNRYNSQYVRLGDNIYLGAKIASIPDIKKMKALTYVNETDIKKVKQGMKVVVRLDALPSVPFNGKISTISKICTTRESEKIFKTEVEIEESDVRLKPGMTVSCEYICHDSDSELFVPNSCLLKEKDHSYIFLDRGRTPRKVEVRTGPSNSNHTIIYGEVKSGQRLVPVEKIDSKKNS
jgi:multidrug efflux pump subunit AcrA (membrane-fusion protein)